jgi:hypothetical protein
VAATASAGRSRFTHRETAVLIAGGCHCGNIRFMLTWLPEPAQAQIPARACGCTFCRKHGGVWTSCPGGALAVTVRDAALVHDYAFGTRTADFHVCRVCGVVPFVTSRIAGRLYAVVSVNALEGVEPGRLAHAPADFAGETEAQRLERRQRYWIGDVRIS